MSIYYVKEIKPAEKNSVGQPIPFSGEWDIQEINSGTTLIKVYPSLEFAEKLINMLYNDTNPKYEDGDIVSLCLLIKKYLKEWISSNPNGLNRQYNDAVYCVLGRIIKELKGKINIELVEQLIRAERKVWEGTNIFLPC